jgi:hypothetical protein
LILLDAPAIGLPAKRWHNSEERVVGSIRWVGFAEGSVGASVTRIERCDAEAANGRGDAAGRAIGLDFVPQIPRFRRKAMIF